MNGTQQGPVLGTRSDGAETFFLESVPSQTLDSAAPASTVASRASPNGRPVWHSPILGPGRGRQRASRRGRGLRNEGAFALPSLAGPDVGGATFLQERMPLYLSQPRKLLFLI